MSESVFMTIGRDAMLLSLYLGGPLLMISLVVGLVISLFQAVTQINEMTLTFVPKIVGMGIILLVFGPWMLQNLVQFTIELFNLLPTMVR